MGKYRYEFGCRWLAETPRSDIKWLVDRYHVETPFLDIEQDILERMHGPQFTAAIKRQAVKYARIIHMQNMDLYCHVMRGKWSDWK
jgi:hypothetical protein